MSTSAGEAADDPRRPVCYPPAVLPTTLIALTLAVTPRWAFEAAYDNSGGGDWYMHDDNETALLAWGESYVLQSLAAMARATGHTIYFDRMARHTDAVLAMRDDARGVADYRGISGACWRNTGYQDGGEAYCYAVHSGMLIYPMAEFARLVSTWRHREATAYDGQTYAAKAAAYVAAAQQTVAFHDDEWDADGFYVFRGDATFLDYPGVDQPLNQSNAMGLALLVLHDVTGEPAYLEKATALAQRFKSMITTGGDGANLWNYWGGPFAGDGEDISHAAINVEFAALAAERGVVFTPADIDGFADTFLLRVYRDDATFSDFVGGGPTDDPGYRPQIGRWLRLTGARTGVYTAVHDAFVRDYPPEEIGSGSVLLGWANLAAFEPPVCPPFFYPHDWSDAGDWQEATAYGANVLATPPDLGAGCRVPLTVDAPRTTRAAQWDGEDMHRATTWRPTAGFVRRSVPYEPRWPLVYAEGGVLFEFQDEFVAGEGILVEEPPVFTPPSITSQPPTDGEPGLEIVYAPSGAGDPPFWWSLADGPVGVEVDPASGALAWTPEVAGDVAFSLVLDSDLGSARQDFVIHVEAPAVDTSGEASSSTGESSGESAGEPATSGDAPTTGDTPTSGGPAGPGDATGGADSPDDAGCGCRTAGPTPWAWLVLALARRRTRRSDARRN
jgi:hypothetical protein